MQPARKDPCHSVQDVIAIVPNGERDVDMDFNDTDASDEESDSHACVDKENQEPNDCPANVDTKLQLNKHMMPHDRYRWQKKDFISANTDFFDVTYLHTPLQYFQKFVSQDMVQALVTNTNEYSIQNHVKSAVSETENRDKLWQLRPWLDSLRENYPQVVPEEHNSVDEMMIPFKGKFSSIKQYMRGKPHPCGFKVWLRNRISGMTLDFDVYQGSNNGVPVKSELGLSGEVVMKSSFAGPEPVQEIQRRDKATKTYIDVERPYIVRAYNKFMGGVDLFDSFTAKYKNALKSRLWYMYIFWHTITIAVVKSWLLYRRNCQALRMPKKEILSMRNFQAQLASSLILCARCNCRRPKKPSAHPSLDMHTESWTFSTENKERKLQKLQ